MESIIHYQDILYNNVSDQETHFTIKHMQQCTYDYENNLSHQISHYPEAAFLIDIWNADNSLEG